MGVKPVGARGHLPRKRFGQHFLTDGAIIGAIVDAINPRAGERMVEIGPGLAALTQPLVERLGHLVVIELDRDLAARLRSQFQQAQMFWNTAHGSTPLNKADCSCPVMAI